MAAPPPRPATLATLLASEPPHWCWIDCVDLACGHRVAVQLADLAAAFGPNVTLPTLWRRFRCSACGHKGAVTVRPSWVSLERGGQAFPTGRAMVWAAPGLWKTRCCPN